MYGCGDMGDEVKTRQYVQNTSMEGKDRKLLMKRRQTFWMEVIAKQGSGHVMKLSVQDGVLKEIQETAKREKSSLEFSFVKSAKAKLFEAATERSLVAKSSTHISGKLQAGQGEDEVVCESGKQGVLKDNTREQSNSASLRESQAQNKALSGEESEDDDVKRLSTATVTPASDYEEVKPFVDSKISESSTSVAAADQDNSDEDNSNDIDWMWKVEEDGEWIRRLYAGDENLTDDEDDGEDDNYSKKGRDAVDDEEESVDESKDREKRAADLSIRHGTDGDIDHGEVKSLSTATITPAFDSEEVKPFVDSKMSESSAAVADTNHENGDDDYRNDIDWIWNAEEDGEWMQRLYAGDENVTDDEVDDQDEDYSKKGHGALDNEEESVDENEHREKRAADLGICHGTDGDIDHDDVKRLFTAMITPAGDCEELKLFVDAKMSESSTAVVAADQDNGDQVLYRNDIDWMWKVEEDGECIRRLYAGDKNVTDDEDDDEGEDRKKGHGAVDEEFIDENENREERSVDLHILQGVDADISNDYCERPLDVHGDSIYNKGTGVKDGTERITDELNNDAMNKNNTWSDATEATTSKARQDSSNDYSRPVRFLIRLLRRCRCSSRTDD